MRTATRTLSMIFPKCGKRLFQASIVGSFADAHQPGAQLRLSRNSFWLKTCGKPARNTGKKCPKITSIQKAPKSV